MAYADPATLAMMRGIFNLGVFFRLSTPNPIRLSFQVGRMPMQLPGDPSGTQYRGCGRLLSLPDLEVLINSMADTVTFSLSGLDPQGVELMLDGAPEVLGVAVMIAFGPLDERWQPRATVIPAWSGTADFISQSGGPDKDGNQKQTISLVAATGDQSRQNQSLLTYSDNSQQAISPGDTFCARTSRAPYKISWPRF